MSASAGTPHAPSSKVARVGGVSLEPSPAGGVALEPSPGSTYGESVTSNVTDASALPPTPTDDTEVTTDKLANLIITRGITQGDASAPVEIYAPPGRRHISPPFVRGAASLDIFAPGTGNAGVPTQRASPTGSNIKSGRATEAVSWRASSSDSSDEVSLVEAARRAKNLDDLKTAQVVPRPENVQVSIPPIDPRLLRLEDPQALFPPSSCVFVANLYKGESDENLTVGLTHIFRVHGPVWVKVKRDRNGMPFAFCQFTNDLHAECAIEKTLGTVMYQRSLRCEKAKAHRLFFFERKYGPAIGPQEVKQMLRQYGTVTMCRSVNPLEQAQYDLNEGVVVQFELYEHGQLALQAFRNHNTFKMQSLAHMNSPIRSATAKSHQANRIYLEEYEIEKRSIFVGNLSADIDEAQLKEAFEKFGNVVKVTIHKNESTVDASQKHCFGFVEYDHHASASAAVEGMVGISLAGKTLKVARKDSEKAKARNKVSRNGSGLGSAARALRNVPPPTMGQMSSAVNPFNYGGAPSGGPFNHPTYCGTCPPSGYLNYPANPAPPYTSSTVTYDQQAASAHQAYVQQAAYAQGAYAQGAYNQGAYAQGAYAQGAYNQGAYNQGVYNQGAYAQGAYNQGAYNQGVYNQGAYNQGVYNQGAYNQGPTSAPVSGGASEDESSIPPTRVDFTATLDSSSES